MSQYEVKFDCEKHRFIGLVCPFCRKEREEKAIADKAQRELPI